ncbi:hypothetical protein BDZ94DRAFT_1371093 [Collybia nuda]|uniref:Uncharacterized protein n=1 Tax=Collybia nuda TaxID=64659 RepID=A0A9P6CGS8_9AGAR|nr:hypothetical protein BDZ94DRAFT_1371093 [Collybia nuda]
MNKFHLTSKNAEVRGDNIFIWRTTPCDNIIVLSWRVDKDLPMTHKSLYRWVGEAVRDIYSPFGPYFPSYLIFPAEITRGENMPLTHVAKRAVDSKSGLPVPPLSPNSLELLKPGDYGFFTPDGEASRGDFNFKIQGSIYQYKTAEDCGKDFVAQV